MADPIKQNKRDARMMKFYNGVYKIVDTCIKILNAALVVTVFITPVYITTNAAKEYVELPLTFNKYLEFMKSDSSQGGIIFMLILAAVLIVYGIIYFVIIRRIKYWSLDIAIKGKTRERNIESRTETTERFSYDKEAAKFMNELDQKLKDKGQLTIDEFNMSSNFAMWVTPKYFEKFKVSYLNGPAVLNKKTGEMTNRIVDCIDADFGDVDFINLAAWGPAYENGKEKPDKVHKYFIQDEYVL